MGKVTIEIIDGDQEGSCHVKCTPPGADIAKMINDYLWKDGPTPPMSFMFAFECIRAILSKKKEFKQNKGVIVKPFNQEF